MAFTTKKASSTYNQADYNALMRSNLPTVILEDPGMRFDGEEDASLFFARELDYIKAKSYDKQYPEMTGLSLFPVSSEVDAGALSITYYSYEKTGMAAVISDYATDLPRADQKSQPHTVSIKSLGTSYGYSIQDMRASRMAGKSLDARRAESARYAVDMRANTIIWAGDAENNLVGVLSENNDIPYYTIPSGADGKTSWKDKTAQEILKDINGMQSFTAKITKNVERPDTLVLASDVFIDISTKQIEGTGYTVKRFILENAPYLKEIVPASELQEDSAETNPTGKNVALLFKKDPDKLTVEIPLAYYQHPVQPKGLEVVVPCEERIAGVILYYPLSLLIALGV